jgi:hypothetical protein
VITVTSRWLAWYAVLAASLIAGGMLVTAQAPDASQVSINHPAIQYATRSTTDRIAALNRKLQAGEITLAFDDRVGYLRSVLNALDVPVESQMLVYSPTSARAEQISESAPRALYFNDTVAVGWVNGADEFELTALDPQQGNVFWTLEQKPQQRPQFVRPTTCLECHLSDSTSRVPGLLVMSMLPLSDNQNEYAQGWSVDHRTPIEDRWGGYYVTGLQVPARHLGNVQVYHAPRSYVRAATAPVLSTVSARIDASRFLTPYSDVVALLVINHQAQMTDLVTRIGWEARVGSPRVREVASELVDYMLFVEEAALPSPVKGSSGFAESFVKRGPRDSKGRSLRDFDLTRRVFKYPCSYMIYGEAFDALPAVAKDAVYARLWEVLSGSDKDQRYARLSATDRTAIVEILRETKKDLPAYFRSDSR